MITPVCAQGSACAATAPYLCDAKIQYLHPLATGRRNIGHQKQILWLQIPVHDPCGVGRCQGRSCLARDFHGLRQGETAMVRQTFLQRHAFQKLHQDVGRALGRHPSVENFDNVAMTDGTGRPRFVEKTPDQLRILRQHLVQNLDGSATFNERVLRKVDFPETAFAEQPHDAVVAKELTCLQRHALPGFSVLPAAA